MKTMVQRLAKQYRHGTSHNYAHKQCMHIWQLLGLEPTKFSLHESGIIAHILARLSAFYVQNLNNHWKIHPG